MNFIILINHILALSPYFIGWINIIQAISIDNPRVMIPMKPGITSAIDNPNSPKKLIAMISVFSSCPNIPFFLSKRHGTSNIYFIITYFPKNIPLANDHAPFDKPDAESTAPVDDTISSTTVGVDVKTPIQTIVDIRPLMVNIPFSVVA